MSIEVAGLALRARTGLGTQAKLVLIGLADHARADGTEARPGVKTLAQYAECSERTVQRHLTALVREGIISVDRKGGGRRATAYRIHLRELAALRPAPEPSGDSLTARTEDGASEVQVGDATSADTGQPVTGDTPVTAGVTIGQGTGDTAVSPEPSLDLTVLEPSEDLKARTALDDPNPNQPTHDQLFLGERLAISVPAIVKLNKRWGRVLVTDAMRRLHGFPPEDGIENVYAYLVTLCELQSGVDLDGRAAVSRGIAEIEALSDDFALGATGGSA